MKKIHFLVLLAILSLGMTSCKYEEGPFISVIPKTERVTNTWVVEEAVINGTSDTEIPGFKEITFFKEGGCQIIYTVLTIDVPYNGTWAFDDKKEGLVLNLDDDATGLLTYQNTWTILRLKEDQMKVSYTEDNATDTYVVTFKPKG